MRILLRKAKVKKQMAEFCCEKIKDDSIFIEDCCVCLESCIELALRCLIKVYGGSYYLNHDVTAQLSILKKLNIHVPDEDLIREKTTLLKKWNSELLEVDSFLACVAEIHTIGILADNLLNFTEIAILNTSKIQKYTKISG